jgi:biotin transport system substrate-specific component
VPLTGQVFVVLLSGIALGGGFAGLSMAVYLLLGFAGLPWFAGWSHGAWFGPTTGYLIGFVPAAVFTGIAFPRAREFLAQALVMTTAVFVIYLFGALHVALILKTGFGRTLVLAVLPFVPLDILKAVAAAGLGRVLVPQDPSRDRS